MERAVTPDHSAVRRPRAERYLRHTLIWFALTVIAVRWALAATGYPKLGGGQLHIAHVSTLVKALARAWRWQRALDEGQFASVRELAEAERVSLSYISRILRLTLLAPDIVERILDGCPAPQLAELMQPFPAAWEQQRSQFC